MARMLEKASPGLAKPLQPKSEDEVGKLQLKLGYAGFRSEAAPQHLPGRSSSSCLVVGFVARRRHDAASPRA